MENYGNFFGQNLFIGSAGVLLMAGTFKSLHINVNAVDLVLASLPIAGVTIVIVWLNNILFDRYLDKNMDELTKGCVMMSETVINRILECFYILAGLQFIYTAYRALKAPNKGKRVGTALFWLILAILFIAGPYLPNVINGLLIVLMGVLTLFKQVTIKNIIDVNEREVEQGARRYGNKLFIPALVLAVVAVIVSNWTPLGGAIGLGVSSVVGLIAALLVIKPKAKYILYDSDRLTQQVGAVGILPQFLAALGVLFTASGVGKVISHGISSFLPEGVISLALSLIY